MMSLLCARQSRLSVLYIDVRRSFRPPQHCQRRLQLPCLLLLKTDELGSDAKLCSSNQLFNPDAMDDLFVLSAYYNGRCSVTS